MRSNNRFLIAVFSTALIAGGGCDNDTTGDCTPTTCEAEGADCGEIDDGCGEPLVCGTCTAPETCGTDNQCSTCTPTTCADEGAECGTVPDGCGTDLECGTCTAPETCGTDNQCGTCTPTTCADEGAECGTVPDGCGTDLDCGTCTSPETCGTDNQCSTCTPTTCADEGAECGTVPDGCGTDLDCGTCAAPDSCGGGGTANICGCTPVTTCPPAPACGDLPDGCGGTIDCGACPISNAFYYGDFVTNNSYDVGFYDGTTGTASALQLANLDGTDVNAVVLSPDGTQLAVSGHDMNVNSDFIYLYDVSDFSTALVLLDTSAAGHVVDVNRMAFSPDGSLLAFTADTESNNEDALLVVPVDGSSAPTRVSPIPPSNGDVKALVWLNNTTIAFAGDVVVDGIDGLWSVDITLANPDQNNVELVPAASLISGSDVATSYLQVDGSGRVYFKADYVVDNLFRLYRVDADGTNLEQVPGTDIQVGGTEASVAGWGLSPDGAHLAFGVEPGPTQIGQVYVLDLSLTAAVAVTAFTGTPGAAETWAANNNAIGWSPDQTLIAFAGDWVLGGTDVDGSAAMFVAPVASTSPVRIARPAVQAPAYDAYQGLFSNDGGQLLFWGDLVSDGEADLFVTADFATANQDATSLRVVTCPESGDIFGVLPTP